MLEKVGDIKEMVMGQIQDMVVTEIIKAGITWLISLLNPAAAFIKACKMIYDVVMFFVEKADADQGVRRLGARLGRVDRRRRRRRGRGLHREDAGQDRCRCSSASSPRCSASAGSPSKIKKILETVQKPVMKVVDWVVGKAVAFGKKAWAGLKKFGGKVKAKGKALLGKAKKKLGIKEKTPEQIEKDKQRDRRAQTSGVDCGKPVEAVVRCSASRQIRHRRRQSRVDRVDGRTGGSAIGRCDQSTAQR